MVTARPAMVTSALGLVALAPVSVIGTGACAVAGARSGPATSAIASPAGTAALSKLRVMTLS